MRVSAVDVISPAFQHARKQLFQPFRFGQWVRLALLGLATGELSSGGGCHSNFNFPAGSHRGTSSSEFLPSMPNLPGLGHLNLHQLVALVAVGVLVGFALMVAFLYLNSVCRFILFDSVLNRNCVFRGSWTRWRQPGSRFFVWQLLVQIVLLMGAVMLIGIPLGIAYGAGWLKQPKEHLLPLVLGGVFLFFAAMAFFLFALLVQVLAKDFLVPMMALEGLDWDEAWPRLLALLNAEKGGYAGYIGMKILLAIAVGIVLGMISVMVILLFLVPVFLTILIPSIGMGGKFTWTVPLIALAVTGGILLFILLMFLLAMISVPAVAFFPAYSIYFFAARFKPLSARLYPVPSVPPVPAEPPPMPPPLPLGPEPVG